MIDESAIRERAYALWEKDACPEGAAKFYWYLAREQLQAQLHAQALVHAQEPDVRNGDSDSVKSPYVLYNLAFST